MKTRWKRIGLLASVLSTFTAAGCSATSSGSGAGNTSAETSAQPTAPATAKAGQASRDNPATPGARANDPVLLDAAVYNANGEQLSLQTLLQGHYTVIVLGCLT